jgi:hypothetical protein
VLLLECGVQNYSCPFAAFSLGRRRSGLAMDLCTILTLASYVEAVIGQDVKEMIQVSMPSSLACPDFGLLFEERAINERGEKKDVWSNLPTLLR